MDRLRQQDTSSQKKSDPLTVQAGRKTPNAGATSFRWLYFLTIFSSAFLLFQIQPLISKSILPWFGGSAALWTTCMLFFQVALLAGYAYAHFVNEKLSPRVQAIVHLTLIVVAIVALPIAPDERWKPSDLDDPTWHILTLLFVSIGIPFFLLSTTAPLMQVWWNRVFGGSPYRLYSFSNAGSLLALLSYPFVVEPAFGLHMQSKVWSIVFVAFCMVLVCCGLLAWRAKGDSLIDSIDDSGRTDEMVQPGVGRRLMWVILSACGSTLLLAVTNHICQDVAVMPFLWVLPLCLYLISFIICFDHSRWYHRGIFGSLMLIGVYLCAGFYYSPYHASLMTMLVIQLGTLFTCCMVCHGELVRLKPSPRYLTSFYLHISFGGALGGIMVAVVAPQIFVDYFEYPLAMLSSCFLFLGILYLDKASRLRRGRPIWAWGLLVPLFIATVFVFSQGMKKQMGGGVVVWASRNFYGTLSVKSKPANSSDALSWNEQVHVWVLRSGQVKHGCQSIEKDKQHIPTTYFQVTSGVGRLLTRMVDRPRRKIGAVGLGVGTIAAYGRENDYFRFYEIDADVVSIANEEVFTYLDQARRRGSQVDIVVGDARLSLGAEEPQEFDVLVLDAFSGDSIPVHLITTEAFELYKRHLRPDGVIALNVSNRLFDLVPLARTIADHHQFDITVIDEQVSTWVLLSPQGILADVFSGADVPFFNGTNRRSSLWTDDFSNLFELLIFENLRESAIPIDASQTDE